MNKSFEHKQVRFCGWEESNTEQKLTSFPLLGNGCNAVCFTRILNSFLEQLHKGLIYTINVAKLWEELYDRYNLVDASHLYVVLDALSGAKHGGNGVST